uniref:Uncharacterized protein n=1 Tax=Megaselia scalaris TaxID=36166 RepID=T1GVM6_MEGSC
MQHDLITRLNTLQSELEINKQWLSRGLVVLFIRLGEYRQRNITDVPKPELKAVHECKGFTSRMAILVDFNPVVGDHINSLTATVC